jgi:hypothetical protein
MKLLVCCNTLMNIFVYFRCPGFYCFLPWHCIVMALCFKRFPSMYVVIVRVYSVVSF